MSNNTDDTMRRIEEALDELLLDAMHCGTIEDKPKLLATIRAALNAQPSPKSGESPAVSAEVAQKDAGGWGEDDERFRVNEAAELLKPHEFTGRHRSYQDLLDEEHERAVEEWQSEATAIAGHCGIARDLVLRMRDDGVRLMRRQPKTTNTETTDGE